MATTLYEDVVPITEYGHEGISVTFTAATWAAYSLGSGQLIAHFRRSINDANPIWQADTDDGTITRPGSYSLKVIIPDSVGEDFIPYRHVHFDFVRVSSGVYTAIPGSIKWPVRPVYTQKADIT